MSAAAALAQAVALARLAAAHRAASLFMVGAALLAGCAAPAPQAPAPAQSQGLVVLLPEPDGRATALEVRQPDARVAAGGAEAVTLARPYAAARLSSAGPEPYTASAQEVQARFGAALAAMPAAPARFTLHFVEGRDDFTEASRRQIDGILAEIARRPVADVVVIGHTDTVGSDAFNDALSRQRAEVVRNALLARGLAAAQVQAVGRGKRELAVPTADGVAEPRNRRVEIQVR
jgi:outer membrane protein OmpA-like peptidoglycan-associated protein